MNLQQINKLSMSTTTDAYLNSNSAILDPLPNYPTCYSVFSAALGQVKLLSEQQRFKTSGWVKNKNELKVKLATVAFDAATKIKTYARFTNNHVLYDEIDFTESDLKYAGEEELREYAQGIYNRGQDNLTELEAYGITADTQTAFLKVLTDYIESIPKSRVARFTGKQLTNQLAQAFITIDAALADIDAIVEIIKLKEPKFYNGYRLARKVIQQGKSSLALKGLILDADTKLPIKNASITLKLKTNGSIISLNGNGSINKKSAEKGGFYLKSLANGVYTVSITKNGYATQEQSIAVTNGEMSRLIVELAKN